jgi:hypothetical protein
MREVEGMAERSNAADLVPGFSQEAAHARRQWANWLGVGSGGGVVALLSFAANLPTPDHALQILAPAIGAFILAIVLAAPALLTQAEENASAALYYSEAHNAQELRAAAHAMPQHIAAPQALADDLNAGRNRTLARAEEHHNRAEKAWDQRAVWKWLRRGLTSASAVAFLVGASYPLYLIESGVSFAPIVPQGPTPIRTNHGDQPKESEPSVRPQGAAGNM